MGRWVGADLGQGSRLRETGQGGEPENKTRTAEVTGIICCFKVFKNFSEMWAQIIYRIFIVFIFFMIIGSNQVQLFLQ